MLNQKNAKRWTWRLALGTTCIVLILSILNKVSLGQVLWRSCVAFIVMYGLMTGSLLLFERSAKSQETGDNANSPDAGKSLQSKVGGLFDQTIGGEDNGDKIAGNKDDEVSLKMIAGQINDVLTESSIDTKQQAEILRKMGWTTEEKADG